MKRIYQLAFMVLATTLFLASCVKDLDTLPIDPRDMTPNNVYTSAAGYKQVLAKCYAGLSVSGQQGPAGNADISGIDEGFGEYLRGYWYHQELPTDEAVIGWNDQTIKDFHAQKWGSGDVFVAAMYYRIFFQVSQCNEFIRESSDDKLNERGINGADREEVVRYRAEVRFLRALSYYHALDLFGNVPFITENDPAGKFFPPQIKRDKLFTYVESELLAIEPLMRAPRTNELGRADQGAVWALLAKLYLNAKVYIGVDKYTECITYCKNIMNAGYSLEPQYEDLFLADNENSSENIFSIRFDGSNTQTWGGTTFIVRAGIGGSMTPADFGVASGWGGTRTTSAFVRKFYPDLAANGLWSSPVYKQHKGAYPILYVPGSYQEWDPTNTTTVLASVLGDEKYEGYLNFPDASTQFKFCTTPDWTNDYGDDGSGTGTLAHPGANIVAADAGYYKINVDMNALTYTLLKTTWGIVGSATGSWDVDQPMTYDATSGMWSATLDLTAGKIKFRANGGWALNYGDNGGDGKLEQDGTDIDIPVDGTYVITMKLGAPDYTYQIVRASFDKRAMFWTDGQNLEINDIGTFTDGYAITKFKNITSTGTPGKNKEYVDNDFILFRLADIYLMYAEAVLRGGSGGDLGTALNVVNKVRTRAYGDTGGNITSNELTLDFILDERARELYWEGYRRTDLIRYGRFSASTYLWPWKGGVADGISTSAIYDLFPIPSSDVSANANLLQNTGY